MQKANKTKSRNSLVILACSWPPTNSESRCSLLFNFLLFPFSPFLHISRPIRVAKRTTILGVVKTQRQRLFVSRLGDCNLESPTPRLLPFPCFLTHCILCTAISIYQGLVLDRKHSKNVSTWIHPMKLTTVLSRTTHGWWTCILGMWSMSTRP